MTGERKWQRGGGTTEPNQGVPTLPLIRKDSRPSLELSYAGGADVPGEATFSVQGGSAPVDVDRAPSTTDHLVLRLFGIEAGASYTLSVALENETHTLWTEQVLVTEGDEGHPALVRLPRLECSLPKRPATDDDDGDDDDDDDDDEEIE